MKCVEHRLDTPAHFFEAGDRLMPSLDALRVGADLLLCGIELEAALLDKIMHHGYLVDVGGCIEPGAVAVSFWLDDGETLLPEAECGSGNAKQLGHFGNLVIFFFNGVHSRELCRLQLQKYENMGNFAP